MSKRYAVISIGTNSTRVLLADLAPEIPHVELARSIGTRIGEGLGEAGSLGEEPMRRTLDAMRQLQRAVHGHYVRLFAVATSALRRADNADAFTQRVQDAIGVPLRVLSGDEEAIASYRGAVTAFEALRGERAGVVDLGGGSTEYAVGTTAEPERLESYEIGAVRLTEMIPQLAGRDGAVEEAMIERARAAAREALAPLREFPAVERVALAGGSATTTAAIVRGRAGEMTSYPVTRTDLQRVLAQLSRVPLEERKTVTGMKRQRADILPAGIIVLDTALELIGRDAAVATTADLLLGFLLQQRDADAAAGQGTPSIATDSPRGRPS